MTGARKRTGGWSLVELSVVLAVLGLLGMVLWRLLPLAPKVAEAGAADRELAAAGQALVGYALAHNGLPPPVVVDGQEMLPVEALGLPSTLRLRYQVLPALAATPGELFSPTLPPAFAGGVETTSAVTNGLDFCMALKNATAGTLPGMDGIPTAFALMHTGPAGHDSLADAAFALPGSAGIGARHVLAVGPGELASRLACPDRVSRTQAAVHAAHAAYDMMRTSQQYKDLRVFAVQVAEVNRDNSQVGVTFAAFDVAWGVFGEAMSILQEAVGWPPDPVGIATGIVSHISATVQLALAIKNLVDAEEDRVAADEDLQEAKDQQAAAEARLAAMQGLAARTLLQARHYDKQGLQR